MTEQKSLDLMCFPNLLLMMSRWGYPMTVIVMLVDMFELDFGDQMGMSQNVWQQAPRMLDSFLIPIPRPPNPATYLGSWNQAHEVRGWKCWLGVFRHEVESDQRIKFEWWCDTVGKSGSWFSRIDTPPSNCSGKLIPRFPITYVTYVEKSDIG